MDFFFKIAEDFAKYVGFNYKQKGRN